MIDEPVELAWLALDRITALARRTVDELVETWETFTHATGAGSVSLDALVHAYDTLDRLRVTLVGQKGGPFGLLPSLTEEIGPRIPRTPEAAQAVVQGVGRVIRHGKAKRTVWDQRVLIPAVAEKLGARIADDPDVLMADRETGEVNPPSEIARRAVRRAVEWCADALGATPSKGWKTGALEGLKLSPDDFRDREWGGFDVRIERGVGVPPSDDDEGQGEEGDG